MPARLLTYVSHACTLAPRLASAIPPIAENDMRRIFILLRARTGHDFTHYKPNTVGRRVGRRMAVHQIDRLDEYVRLLQQTPAEVDALFRDLLIGVTSFFRDPDAFAALQEHVMPAAVSGSVPRDGASASGSRAAQRAKKRTRSPCCFRSTWTRRTSVSGCRSSRPTSTAAPWTTRERASIPRVSPPTSREARLARFFIQEPGGGAYRVCKPIRDMLVVSEQDVVLDPPFSRLDLISCRNVLIYMGSELQKKLIPLFHYALNTGGFLLLGTSETVGEHGDLFATVDRQTKLYRSEEGRKGMRRPSFGEPGGPRRNDPAPAGEGVPAGDVARPSLRDLVERTLLQHHAPSAALVTESGDIVYLHGRTGLYLEPAPGESGMNILKMAREGLRRDLSNVLRAAVAHNASASRAGVRVKTNGDYTHVTLTVRPVTPGADAPGLRHACSWSPSKTPIWLTSARPPPSHRRQETPGPHTGTTRTPGWRRCNGSCGPGRSTCRPPTKNWRRRTRSSGPRTRKCSP